MKKQEYLKLREKTKRFMDSIGWKDFREQLKGRLRKRK